MVAGARDLGRGGWVRLPYTYSHPFIFPRRCNRHEAREIVRETRRDRDPTDVQAKAGRQEAEARLVTTSSSERRERRIRVKTKVNCNVSFVISFDYDRSAVPHPDRDARTRTTREPPSSSPRGHGDAVRYYAALQAVD